MNLPQELIKKILEFKEYLENPPYCCEHVNVKKNTCNTCYTTLCDKCKWKKCWCYYE